MAAESGSGGSTDVDRIKKSWRKPCPKSRRVRKKRPRNPEEWHKQKQKRLRIAGKEHINTNGKVIPEKKPGEDCHCRRKCFERIPEAIRLKTFEGFYSMKTHDEQNAYLFGLMRQVDIKRKRKKDSIRRTCTFEYFIRVRGRETQVCQTAFKNIHAITERKVRVLCRKMDDGVMFPSDNRGKNRSNRLGEVRLAPEIIDQIKSHIYSIVHTHRLKDFIRCDKVTGLEINISKMWKDYTKIYDPTYSHYFEAPFKGKKKQAAPEEPVHPPQIMNNGSQDMPGPSSDTYCVTYGNNSIVNFENYIAPTMIAPNQYPSQHISMGNYITTDKMSYYPQRQVVVQHNNMQQLIQPSDPLALPLNTLSTASQQTFVNPESNTFLIVHAISSPALKREQTVEENKSEKSKIKKKGPLVRQWRYTSIFHDLINGEILAAIKTRLPLYFSEADNEKKKAKSSSLKPIGSAQQLQPIQCQQQPPQHQQIQQQHQQQQQLQQSQIQQSQLQQSQQHQQHQQIHIPSGSQSLQHMHG